MKTWEGLLLWAVIIAAYWAPTVVAFARHIPGKWQIFVVNFFGFVFGIGWIVALVWAIKPAGAHENLHREDAANRAAARYAAGEVRSAARHAAP